MKSIWLKRGSICAPRNTFTRPIVTGAQQVRDTELQNCLLEEVSEQRKELYKGGFDSTGRSDLSQHEIK